MDKKSYCKQANQGNSRQEASNQINEKEWVEMKEKQGMKIKGKEEKIEWNKPKIEQKSI